MCIIYFRGYRLEKDGFLVDIPAKWKIKLPMDTLEEVAEFNKKLLMVTTDDNGAESSCKMELVYELNNFNMYFSNLFLVLDCWMLI